MSKASNRYTWARNNDGCGKSVVREGAKGAVVLSVRTSAFPSHPTKPKSKNRVWRPSRPAANQPIEKPTRVPGRRSFASTAPGSSTKSKDPSHEVSLGPSTTHRRVKAAGLHGNRVWVAGKAPTAVGDETEKSESTASLLAPQRVAIVSQSTLRYTKPLSTMDAIVANRPTLDNTKTSTSSSSPGHEKPGRVAEAASVVKRRRKKTHGNLVWRPGQASVPGVSSVKQCGAVPPSKGAVSRKVGALRTTKYRWQRKLSAELLSPSGTAIYCNSHPFC